MSNTTPPPEASPPPPVYTGPPPRIAHGGKTYEYFGRSGFSGYVPVLAPSLPERKPYMAWVGPKLSWEVWQQVLAFFEWSQNEFKSEVQVRLYCNLTSGRWAAWAFPQEPNGMTTKELPDHAGYADQRAQFRDPWILLGTVHHHCTSGAFQSGTDSNNERSQDGVHITVGKIGSSEYDLHGRVILRSEQFDVDWLQWFSAPGEAANYPPKLREQVVLFFLKAPPPKDTPFPETWKTNCVKNSYATVGFQGSSQSGSASASSATGRGGSGTQSSGEARTGTETPIDTNLEGQFTGSEIEFMRSVVALGKAAGLLSHSRLDQLVNDAKAVDAPDVKLVADVRVEAARLGITRPRTDELIDKWSFDVVIIEIDRVRALKAAQGHHVSV